VLQIGTHGFGRTVKAWSPYLYLVALVLVWGSGILKDVLNSVTLTIEWPGLHNLVQRMAPVVPQQTPYAAVFSLNWLSAGGSACAIATLARGDHVPRVAGSILRTARLGAEAARVLAADDRVGAGAFVPDELQRRDDDARPRVRGDRRAVPVLQRDARLARRVPDRQRHLGERAVRQPAGRHANSLGLDPALMASANSSGGVMGKMISLQSLAVACAATGMKRDEEGKLFRFTFKHSVFLASVLGVITMIYAYA
jgi:L-lactate permease